MGGDVAGCGHARLGTSRFYQEPRSSASAALNLMSPGDAEGRVGRGSRDRGSARRLSAQTLVQGLSPPPATAATRGGIPVLPHRQEAKDVKCRPPPGVPGS